MSVNWGSIEKDDACWTAAKALLGISDVRTLTQDQFRALIALAQSLKDRRTQ